MSEGRELYRVYGKIGTGRKLHDACSDGWPAHMHGRTDCGAGTIDRELFKLSDLTVGVEPSDHMFFMFAEHGVKVSHLCANCYPIRTRQRYAGWIRKANNGEIDLEMHEAARERGKAKVN